MAAKRRARSYGSQPRELYFHAVDVHVTSTGRRLAGPAALLTASTPDAGHRVPALSRNQLRKTTNVRPEWNSVNERCFLYLFDRFNNNRPQSGFACLAAPKPEVSASLAVKPASLPEVLVLVYLHLHKSLEGPTKQQRERPANP